MEHSGTVLILGATGATGRLLVEQLLRRGARVKVVVRTTNNLPSSLDHEDKLVVIQASILELGDSELIELVSDCDAVACCLGHTLSMKGLFGPPYRLVTEATRRLCNAVRARDRKMPVKFVLMNTSGNSNRDRKEQISLAQKFVIWLLRTLLPPHADNEQAADYLRTQIGQNDDTIEWVAVRPDSLIDESEASAYRAHPSPTRSAIFDAGVTSRINVACFMADLICDGATWSEWKGQMPVLYNKDQRDEPTART